MSDQEPAILDVKNKVIEGLGEAYNVVREESPVEGRQANGAIERAVQSVGGIVRTLRLAVE
eukprot:9112555-Pyramimonas_sp.AAC.1